FDPVVPIAYCGRLRLNPRCLGLGYAHGCITTCGQIGAEEQLNLFALPSAPATPCLGHVRMQHYRDRVGTPCTVELPALWVPLDIDRAAGYHLVRHGVASAVNEGEVDSRFQEVDTLVDDFGARPR